MTKLTTLASALVLALGLVLHRLAGTEVEVQLDALGAEEAEDVHLPMTGTLVGTRRRIRPWPGCSAYSPLLPAL